MRRWAYGIAAAAAPILAVYGLIAESTIPLWLNLAGAALYTVALGNTPAREDTEDNEPTHREHS